MPELAFVMSPRQNWYLREFAETLRYELEHQAVPSTVHTDGFPEPQPQTVYVLVAPQEYLALEGKPALPDDEILARTILLCFEPPDKIERDEYVEVIRRAGAVFCTDPRSVALLRRLGVPARHLKPGYSKLRDAFDPEAERPIDVMFLGAHSLRRTRRLSCCARILARRNCLLQIADGSRPNPGGSSSFLAEGKWNLLEQTKVLLNVHRDEDPQLEWFRVLDAIHAGAVVVSEHSSGVAPLVPGQDLLVASPDALPDVLEAALSDEELLGRIRTQAHERLCRLMPFALSASVFRAAAVEIVGRPYSPKAERGRRATVTPDPWTTPASDRERDIVTLQRGLSEMGAEVIALRREVARLEQMVRFGAHPPPGSRIISETPRWSARRNARVTVITALSGRADMVEATLGSLARSFYRDFELVLIDDASGIDSVDLAREWIQNNPRVPAVLVGNAVNRGLGAARNTGLDLAEAPYCLVLDAGNAVYPRCLEVLVGTLDKMPDVAFVYPITEVRWMTEAFVAAGGDYLLNVFGWEPRRLSLWARPAGLSLFQTKQLSELGGFATDPQLAGWEDHDLWCRVADRGWRAQLVPQILGRYHVSSTIVARLSDLPPAATLIDRAPRFLAGVGVPPDA